MEKKQVVKKIAAEDVEKNSGRDGKREWTEPTFEDVSGRVMAQPYIRFT